MNGELMSRKLDEAIEELATSEHERWSHWQRYMHQKGNRLDDGSLVLPGELVDQWERQIQTPYRELSEAEKESDREQVRRYLPIIKRALGD